MPGTLPSPADASRQPVTRVECLTAYVRVLGDVLTTCRTFAVYATGSSRCFEEWHSASRRMRGGIDLNPLDAADLETCRWLLTLVWPEHEDRRARLVEAWDIARRERPDVRRGDLLGALPALAAEALAALPGDGRLLVFDSAAIPYLDVRGREQFAALMRDLSPIRGCTRSARSDRARSRADGPRR